MFSVIPPSSQLWMLARPVCVPLPLMVRMTASSAHRRAALTLATPWSLAMTATTWPLVLAAYPTLSSSPSAAVPSAVAAVTMISTAFGVMLLVTQSAIVIACVLTVVFSATRVCRMSTSPPAAGGGGAVTVTVLVAESDSASVLSLAVKVTVYAPAVVYVWLGFSAVDVAPSPKSHSHVSSTAAPVRLVVLVKVTVSGACPVLTSCVNEASRLSPVGAAPTVNVSAGVVLADPPAGVARSVSVYVPAVANTYE